MCPHSISFLEFVHRFPTPPLLCREEMPTQAQRDELAAPITEWVRKHPDTECNMSNGRGDLLDHVKNLKPGKTDAQLAGVISALY
jgi:hypothetical protein